MTRSSEQTKIKVGTIIDAFSRNIVPPPDLTIEEWASRYRILPETSSSESGLWRTSRFPFTREIMEVLSPQHPCHTVVFMKGSQVAGTEIALNFIGYTCTYKPAPTLYVQKTIHAVERFSKQRLQPSIDACPVWSAKMGEKRSRDSENTIFLKSFPGGILILGGTNSAASLRSMPIQNLILDEEDSFEEDVQDEGAPSELAIRRTSNFPKKKIFHNSTPGIKEVSRIEPLFLEGDQRYFYVPCPFCGCMQRIIWDKIIYKDENGNDDLDNIYMQCEACKGKINERYKAWMFEKGEWRKHNPNGSFPSFHLSALYSPIGFYSWKEAVELWLKAERKFSKEDLKVFINTVLGETFSELGKSVEPAWIEQRKEVYSSEVPEGVLLLVAGCDVQENRIECEIMGVGADEESWSIDYSIFQGDTESSFVWQLLLDYLGKRWKHPSGIEMNIACTAIDSGHRAKVVYSFCKKLEFKRVFPIKGDAGWGKGYLNRPTKRNQEGVYLFTAYVDELKSKIYSTLRIEQSGPGYCHFPNRPTYDRNYFRRLTSETLTTKRYQGHDRLVWELRGGLRNEPLDCRAYAWTAFYILNPNLDMIAKRGTPLVVRDVPMLTTRKRVISKGY